MVDDIRKNQEHGFERNGLCLKIRIFRILPIVPKIKINIPKYRLINTNALSNIVIVANGRVDDDIILVDF